MNASSPTVHACAVEVAGIGILIEGPSGSGKTSLAFGLVEAARARGMEAALVADDRTILVRSASGVAASAPASLAGLAELRGHGIVSVEAKPDTLVGMVVRLVEDGEAPRMPEPAFADLLGLPVPLVLAPRRHEAQAVRICLARLAELRGDARPLL